jgi:hypothetical protein
VYPGVTDEERADACCALTERVARRECEAMRTEGGRLYSCTRADGHAGRHVAGAMLPYAGYGADVEVLRASGKAPRRLAHAEVVPVLAWEEVPLAN